LGNNLLKYAVELIISYCLRIQETLVPYRINRCAPVGAVGCEITHLLNLLVYIPASHLVGYAVLQDVQRNLIRKVANGSSLLPCLCQSRKM